jgi:flagellar hook-associated protein 3 FlgL
MIQGLSGVAQEFLANLATTQQQLQATQEQISSGVTINQPSDNPAELGDVLQLESNLGRVNQVTSNLGLVQGEVNTGESALENATSLMEQVTQLGAEGANSTSTATERTSLSQQVEQILSQLVSVSQTQYNGSYVFSGGDANSPSYQLDLNSAKGVDQLSTSPSTRLIQDATGQTFAVSLTAQQIFDDQNSDGTPAPDNVFAAVNSLRVALANNDTTGIANAMTSVSTASNYLQQQLAFYGGVQDEVSNSITVAQKFQTQYQTSLTNETGTNMATAAVDMAQETDSMQAAIQAEASIPHTSLFSMIGNS